MKHLIIIGARGFGREVYHQAIENLDPQEYDVKGFLDDKTDALSEYNGYPPIISSVEDYIPEENDVFFCALGDPYYRRKYSEIMLDKNAEFISIISKNAYISPNVEIGKGTIIYGLSYLSSDVRVGNFCNISVQVCLGHDVKVLDYAEIEPGAKICGFATVGENVIVHSNATVIPHVIIGRNTKIGAGSVVLKDVDSDVTVFGNPARPFMKRQIIDIK